MNGYIKWGVIFLILKRIYTDEFDALFNGTIILDLDIENKLHLKHKVYQDDLEDALGDPYRVVLKPKQSSKAIPNCCKII
jgi:hypothetical protein